MVDLLTDFTRNDGVYMLLTGKSPLKGDRMNRIQQMMLSSVEVPHLLPLVVREVDDDVSFRYNITGKRMLSQCLKQDQLELTEFYSLLLQIVAVLESSKQYMLSPNQFYLDEHHTFVEEPLSSGVLYFTYVPLKESIKDEPFSQMFLNLVTRIMTSVGSITGDGVQKLLRWCSDERFTLAETKTLISDLMTEKGPERSEIHNESRYKIREYISDHVPEQGKGGPESARVPEKKQPVEHSLAIDLKEFSDLELPSEKQERKASSLKTYVALGALLAAALLWKFVYLDHPGILSLLASLGGTLLLAGGLLLFKRGIHLPRPGNAAEAIRPSEEKLEPEKSFEVNRYNWEEIELPDRADRSISVRQRPFLEVDVERKGRLESSQAVISPVPQTVLLAGGELQKLHSAVASYCLERGSTIHTAAETITLSKGSFVIGRSEEIAQYIDTSPGVSRAHVELVVRSTGCSLRDLGSRNGTRLGDEMIAPYKEYSLNPGDSFAIAESRYTLRIA